MKLKNLLFMGLASAFIFAGCEEKEDFGPAEISINPSGSIEIPMAGGDDNVVTIKLKATIDWALRGYDEAAQGWLSIEPTSGKASSSPQTITIKATPNPEANRSASIVFYGDIMHKASLTITQPGAKGEAGTVSNPFTVSDAIKFIDDGKYSGNDGASDEVYVTGKISEIESSYDSKYGSAHYIISDETSKLEVFGGKYISGISFNKEGLIKVGDEVIIYGQLTNYNGKYEFIADNYIYSLNGKTTVGADFDQTVPGGPWIYSHSFVAGLGDKFTIEDKKIDEALSYVWNFDVKYACMKASAYISIDEDNGINYETESWLISPVIDLTSESTAYLTFEHATNFFDNAQADATVWIKEEGAADWEQVTGVTYHSTQGWTLVDAGDIDNSSYASKKIQIAFEYKRSSEKAGTWEVKNVVVKREADEVLPPVEVTEGSVILTFPDDNKENNKVNGYVDPWTAMSGDYSFTITAFNNSNWNNWTYIRCGRKDNDSVASISNATALPALTLIEVTVDDILDVSKVNSITMSIYSDAELSTPVAENIDPSTGIVEGSMRFEIPAGNQAADQYYKLTFDCASHHSKNGIIQISKVTYIAAE